MIMNIKRYIALIISIFLLCASIIAAPVTLASDRDEDFTEANTVIMQLAGDFFAGENVTREQFAGALVRTMKIACGDEDGFSFADVNDKNEYSAEIYDAVKAGIISKDRKFNPSDNITLAQAVKMCICAIGYTAPAEKKGGYPSGYLRLAKDIKLTAKVYDTNELSKEGAVKLLYNLLCCTIMPTEYKDGFIHFTDTDETYMERLYNVTCTEGLVTATNICPENGDAAEEDGYIVVDEVRYSYDGATDELLGKNVRVFFDKNNEDALFAVERRNTVIEESYGDVTELSGRGICIKKDGESKKYYKTEGARYVYNGRRVSDLSRVNIHGDCTRIVLLDNNRDNNYEYIFVNDYRYLIADAVAAKIPAISDANNDTENSFKAADSDIVLSVRDENSAAAEIDDLKKGDVLAIAEAADGSFAQIRKINKKLDGVITAAGNDGKLYIDDKEYVLTGYAKRNYKDITKIGESYSFVIGFDDDIIELNNFSSKMQYGYLIDAAKEKGAFTDEIQMKVYTLNSAVKIFNIKQAKLDGSAKKKANEILPVLQGNISRLIRFKTGADGKVSVIDTAKEVYAYEEATDEEDSLKQYKFKSGATDVTEFTYRSGGQSCMPYFNVSSSVLLIVPEDGDDENDFAVLDRTSLSSGSKYKFDVYDMSESGTPQILVAKNKTVKSRTNYMIEKIKNGTMPDGGDGKVLQVYTAGAYRELFLSAETEGQLEIPLNPGDIVQATVADDGSVKFIDLVFSAKTMLPSTKTVSGISYEGLSNISYWYGSLYYTDGVYAYISKVKSGGSYDYSFGNLVNLKVNVANIGLINKERNEIRPVTPAELQDYKSFGDSNYFLVVRLNAQAPMEVYAYEAQ